MLVFSSGKRNKGGCFISYFSLLWTKISLVRNWNLSLQKNVRLKQESKNCHNFMCLKASRLLRCLNYSLFLIQSGILFCWYPEVTSNQLYLATSWTSLGLGLSWSCKTLDFEQHRKGVNLFSSRLVNSAKQIVAICTLEQLNTGLTQHSEDVECYISTNKVTKWRLIPVHCYAVIHTAKLLAQSWVWPMPTNLILNSA